MSMMDNILGMGRYGSVNEFWEPELRYDDFDSIEPLGEGVDPMEFMMESIFNNELNMRNLDTAIMCEEYTYLRNHGTEMVYEAGTISNIIEKAKNTIIKIWEDIQKFIKNQIENFTKRSEKDFIRRYKSKAAGKTVRVKAIPDLLSADWKPKNIVEAMGTAFTGFEQMARTVADAARGTEVTNDQGQKELKIEYIDTEEIIERHKDAIDLSSFGVKSSKNTISDLSDIPEALNDTYSEVKESIDMNNYKADIAIEYLDSLTNARKDLRPLYDKSKKDINQYLKTLKKMESVAKRFRIIPTDTSTEIHKAVRTINKLGSCTAAVNRFTLKLLNLCKSQYKAIIVSAAAQANKKLDAPGSTDDDSKAAEPAATAESFIEALQII